MKPGFFRRLTSSLFVVFCALSVLLALVPLAFVLFFVVSDALISGSSFALAYMLRFHWLANIIPVTKGYPQFEYYGKLLPFVMAILPLAFHVQGVYHLRRGRSRVDDFFAVFVGSILAVVFGVGGTLYYNSQGISNIPINGSGRWELKDDGALCAKFNTAPPSRATDARSPEDGCWYFFRDGDKLMRSTSIEPQALPQAEVVRIQ